MYISFDNSSWHTKLILYTAQVSVQSRNRSDSSKLHNFIKLEGPVASKKGRPQRSGYVSNKRMKSSDVHVTKQYHMHVNIEHWHHSTATSMQLYC